MLEWMNGDCRRVRCCRFTLEAELAEEKRAKLAEAAERRQKEAASRGILDIQSVEAKRKKKEQLEKQMDTPGPPAGGLRWTVS
ncbi:small VCP/p97-interacting protein isoform X1 [Peromyscus californicus insignis]|uniref:small VCP/p97-interacting protein isoform X1 n=1 Tax=Peromyscus californicus insignis TaxID=564181 RepID=UPI0022A7C252|nr:small VCP/p97-interacting protein isoform X1 [Peromyscus californicus insignis]